MAPTEATDSVLESRDIGDANALVAAAGWNQVAADWEIFLAAGRVHAMRDAGRVVATAAILPYQGFGWISMVLVDPAHRRRGLAKHLLHRCVDDLGNAGLLPGLDATPTGRELYRRLGFQDSWGFRRLVWRARARTQAQAAVVVSPDLDIRPLGDSDWPDLVARDRLVFGADRSAILAGLRQRLPRAAWCARSGNRLVGYLLGRDGRAASQLGPLVADSDAIAMALLARGLDAVPGAIYVDVPDAKPAVRDWLQQLGFTVERPLTRMFRGSTAGFGDVRTLAAIAGPELG